MKKVEEDAPAVNTGSIPNPAQTAMGPRFTTTNVMDRRKKKRPALLKRFSRFIDNVNEGVTTTSGDTHTPHRTWTAPKPHEEHDEVHTQQQTPHGTYPDHVHKMLDYLSDKDNYQSAMKKAKTVIVNKMNAKKMSNTDAYSSRPAKLDKEKDTRVRKQFASGKPMQKPIVLHDTHTGHMHLLAGNTRLTHNTHGDHPGAGKTPVHAIQYDSSKPKRFSRFIEGVNEEYYRIDHGNAPKTFSGNQSHGYDDDGNHIKGVYATHKDHSMGHAYAAPRNVPWVYHEHENGEKHMYVHKDHENKVENNKATLSTFKKGSGFKGLDGGTEENISSKDQTPATQSEIKSGDHIRKQGIQLHYVDSNTFNQKAKQTNAKNNGLKVAGNENVK